MSRKSPTLPGMLTALEALALALEAQATATQAQITRARLEAEWRTKKGATKAQAAPCGLFAQEQTELL